MRTFERPVILLGNGARGGNIKRLESLGVPIITSWPAKDLVDNFCPNYMGSTGIYGNRAANKALFHADAILALGNRMSLWNVGYEPLNGHITQVEIDRDEVRPGAEWINKDCREVIETLHIEAPQAWQKRCCDWNLEHPWIEPAHEDQGRYMSAYKFTDDLQKYFTPDQIIVTDMGTPLTTAHQVLRLKPPQRLMTSGGLGEMGVALTAAIGASFATNKGKVLCLHGDGGMMLNLQELQTIVHHKLPIKIIVYRNEGYLMIRHTQANASMKEHGVHPASGLSFPNYRSLALDFGITAGEIITWDDYDRLIPGMMSCEGPCLIEFHMHPTQKLVPKLEPIFVDGKPTSPPFWQMSP